MFRLLWWLGDKGQGGRRTFMNSFICLRSMRAWNSRCSEALSPSLGEAVRIGYVIFHILPAMPTGINRDSSRMGELLTRPYLCIGWGDCVGGCEEFVVGDGIDGSVKLVW